MSIEIPKEHLDYLQTYLAQPVDEAVFELEMVEKISEWVLKRTHAVMDDQDATNLVKYAMIVTDCHMQSSLRALIPDVGTDNGRRAHAHLRERLDDFLGLIGPKH
jgi:hypothetical protein